MAVTFLGDVGGANNKTSGTTLATTVTSNVPVGSLVVVMVSADNLSATTPTFTFSDSVGNTYTTVVQKAQNATAAGGVAGALGVALVTNALVAASSTVTVTVSSAVTAKISEVFAFSGASGVSRSAAVSASGASTAPSVTSGSANVGDLVLGLIAYEDAVAVSAADADTTNGSWSAATNTFTTGGNAQSNVALSFQYKITTTATGTQTFNNTLASSQDWAAMVAVLKPAVQATATGSGTGTQSASIPPVSFTDDFTRSNSTTSVGGNWTQTGVLGINSNTAYMVSGTSGVAIQPIQSSSQKQVVRARIGAPSTASAMRLYIAYQDTNNWVALTRVSGFATWNLESNISGVLTNRGNTGLSNLTDAWVTLVRDGSTFYGSVQATTAGSGQSRTASFTITGLTGNGVGFGFDVAGTTYFFDDFSARPLATSTVTANGSGAGTQSASGLKSVVRTASGSGTGSQTASGVVSRFRSASGSGVGTQTASRVVTRSRTASGSGTGSGTALYVRTKVRTASGSGVGTGTAAVGNVISRTASGSGSSSFDAFYLITRLRSASGSGSGSSLASAIVVKIRTATGFGYGLGIGKLPKVRTAIGSGTGYGIAYPMLIITEEAIGSGVGSSYAISARVLIRVAYGSAVGASTTISEREFRLEVSLALRKKRQVFYPPASKPVERGKPLQPPRVRW